MYYLYVFDMLFTLAVATKVKQFFISNKNLSAIDECLPVRTMASQNEPMTANPTS